MTLTARISKGLNLNAFSYLEHNANRKSHFLNFFPLKTVGRKTSETDSIKSQISSKTSRGKQDSKKKGTINDITSDSQVNSYFTDRWSSACLTFNIYFYLFPYLYITRITINNDAPHLKSPKNQTRRAPLRRPTINNLRDQI